ncbi:MAG: hypothetical protein AABZ60_11075, partial [Planctomycetota bacterium]
MPNRNQFSHALQGNVQHIARNGMSRSSSGVHTKGQSRPFIEWERQELLTYIRFLEQKIQSCSVQHHPPRLPPSPPIKPKPPFEPGLEEANPRGPDEAPYSPPPSDNKCIQKRQIRTELTDLYHSKLTYPNWRMVITDGGNEILSIKNEYYKLQFQDIDNTKFPDLFSSTSPSDNILNMSAERNRLEYYPFQSLTPELKVAVDQNESLQSAYKILGGGKLLRGGSFEDTMSKNNLEMAKQMFSSGLKKDMKKSIDNLWSTPSTLTEGLFNSDFSLIAFGSIEKLHEEKEAFNKNKEYLYEHKGDSF